MSVLRDIGKFLLYTIGAYFVGAIASLAFSLLFNLVKWIHTFPMWGIVIGYILIGYVLIDIYKKLFKSKSHN